MPAFAFKALQGMTNFNTLKYDPVSNKLIIDVSVKDGDNYKDVYIDEVRIYNQNTYTGNEPASDNYVYSWQDDCIASGSEATPVKSLKLTLNEKDVKETANSTNGSLVGVFFVYVSTTGTPAETTPCDAQNNVSLGVVANMQPFHERTMRFMRQFGDTCSVPQGLIDSIMQTLAIDALVRAGDNAGVARMYKKFKDWVPSMTISSGRGCGCANH